MADRRSLAGWANPRRAWGLVRGEAGALPVPLRRADPGRRRHLANAPPLAADAAAGRVHRLPDARPSGADGHPALPVPAGADLYRLRRVRAGDRMAAVARSADGPQRRIKRLKLRV